MRSPDVNLPVSLSARLWRFGINTPWWLMIPLALLATELLPLPFDFAANLLFPHQPHGGPNLTSHGIVFAAIMACLVAPLVETAVNQWGCITLLRKLGAGPWTAVFVSAALFAALHFYSWKYVFTTFPVGLVLGYVFIVEQMKRGRAFAIVAAIHALRNAISVALIFALH
jgi:uncharacterized protein